MEKIVGVNGISQLDGLEKLDFNYGKLQKFPESICHLKKINTVILSGTKIGKIAKGNI